MHVLSVCRTCPRWENEKGGMPEALREAALPDGFRLRTVECLGGCLKACNVALDSPAKWRVRLSGLTVAHVPDLLLAASAYAAAPDGRLTDEALPPGLRGHVSAMSPKFTAPR